VKNINNSTIKSKKARLIASLELLKTFSNKELEDFGDYINCNYHNANKKLCVLFKKLKQYALNTESFTEDIQLKIYQDVFGKATKQKTINQVQKKDLNKAMNYLLELAENFLMTEQLKQNEALQYDLLFPKLIDRKQFVLYNRRLKTLQKELEKNAKRGIDYYTTSYNLQIYMSAIFYISNRLAKEDNYDTIEYYLDVKYILEKLRNHLAKITAQKMLAHKQYEFGSFKAIKNLLELPQYNEIPIIQLYRLNIDLVEKDDISTFNFLFKRIKEQGSVIPTDLLKHFYSNLTNYCAYKIESGRLQFYDKMFEIYNSMHDLSILTSRNVMDVRLLKNIITIACRVEKFEWAKSTLAYYLKNIYKDVRQSVFHYNSGIIAFNKCNYSEALVNFNQVQKIDDTHDIGVRVSRLKCFYEIDENYEITTQKIIDNIKVYFTNNKKLTKNEKIAYNNFISIFNKLYKFKDIPGKSARQKKIEEALPNIQKHLSNIDLIKEKKWLINKIETLK